MHQQKSVLKGDTLIRDHSVTDPLIPFIYH